MVAELSGLVLAMMLPPVGFRTGRAYRKKLLAELDAKEARTEDR